MNLWVLLVQQALLSGFTTKLDMYEWDEDVDCNVANITFTRNGSSFTQTIFDGPVREGDAEWVERFLSSL